MINLADINRAGHWMNTHKIPLLPKVMQLIAFLFYSSAVSYKVKIGKGTFFNHGGFGVLINSNVVIGDCCKIGNNVSIVGQGPYKCVPVLKDRVYWWTNGQLRPVTERIPESRSIGVLLLAVILPLAFSACSSDTDEAVFFTGSSLVEKWDVRRFFPTKVTYNAGLSGAGIDYVESQGKQFKGENVVLIIGGNDVVSVNDTEAYVERYLRMLQNMEAKRIYLYSILPRLAFESDGYEKVRLLNKKIREGVTERLDNVVYIDVFDLFLEGGRLNEQYFYDGTHLNEWGYALISGELKKVLL